MLPTALRGFPILIRQAGFPDFSLSGARGADFVSG